ncbi:MAG: nuclear transport factor 2 family protein [Gemmatimonadota bacterium]
MFETVLVIAVFVTAGQGDGTAIRAARDRFNAAIARHDLEALGADWSPSISVVTSRGVTVQGRAAYLELFTNQFRSRSDLIFRRDPGKITVQTPWGMAGESGSWQGRWTDPDGPVRVEGTYLAQWRKAAGTWKLTAELFVQTKCEGGAFCKHPPQP